MKKIHGYFDGIYKNDKDEEFAVHGNFTTFPSAEAEILSGQEFIITDYWIVNLSGKDFGPGYLHYCAYMRPSHDEWQIGDIRNQQFYPFDHHFFNWLKTIIVDRYLQQDQRIPVADSQILGITE